MARLSALSAFVRRVAPRATESFSAALLLALLRSVGELARIDFTRELLIVTVTVSASDVGQLPPFAQLLKAGPRVYEVGLAPWQGCSALGYLPPPVRDGLRRRRTSLQRAS